MQNLNQKTKIIHTLFWFIFVSPYIILKLFFYNTGWIGIFIAFYLCSPVLFILYLFSLNKYKIHKKNDRYLFISLAIIFISLLFFVSWSLYNIIIAGFNFRMI